MKREFIYFPKFEKLWKEVGLNDNDFRDLEIELLENPKAGVVIKGTNGLRKIRWNIRGKGKRGGIRILYIDIEEINLIFMITLIKKNEKEDINSSDKKMINDIISKIKKK